MTASFEGSFARGLGRHLFCHPQKSGTPFQCLNCMYTHNLLFLYPGDIFFHYLMGAITFWEVFSLLCVSYDQPDQIWQT